MNSYSNLESKITGLTRVLSLIGLIGLLLLACITVVEVFLRWLFDFPILGVSDVASLVITISVASCFPLVFAERRSITVRVIGVWAGKLTNSILEAFGSFVTIIVFIFLTWELWRYTDQIALNNQTTWVMLWPVAPWYRIATILIALCLPAQILIFFNEIKSAIRFKKPS